MAPARARAESAKKDRSPSDCRRAFPPELHGRVLHVASPPPDALLSAFADESVSRPPANSPAASTRTQSEHKRTPILAPRPRLTAPPHTARAKSRRARCLY